MSVPIDIDTYEAPTPEAVSELTRALVGWNDRVAPPEQLSPLAVFARREAVLVGGVAGRTHWGWLFVSHLWVADDQRGTGLGSTLMRRIEEAAITRGARSVHLDTYDFQARGFYEKLGYRLFGSLPEYPPGYSRHFLTKDLA